MKNHKIITSDLIQFCSRIFIENIVPRISREGNLIVQDTRGKLSGTRVATHHLVELLTEMDSRLFSKPILSATQWFTDVDNDPQNPFYTSTLAISGLLQPDEKRQLAESILRVTRPSGIIDYFTGFIEGGLLFSTAWAARILLLLQDADQYMESISTAIHALANSWSDAPNSSLKGFYAELLAEFTKKNINTRNEWTIGIQQVVRELINAQTLDGTWDDDSELCLLYTSYVASDLAGLAWTEPEVISACQKAIESFIIFNPINGSIQFSPKVLSFKCTQKDSNYVQLLLRFILLVTRHLRNSNNNEDLSQSIASAWIGSSITVHQELVESNEYRDYLKMTVGSQIEKYSKYREQLQNIWLNVPFEKSIFIMMPFLDSTIFRELTRAIKKTCESRGYIAIRTDDPDRQFSQNLWENLIINMLSSRFGIAVYVDAIASGLIDRNEVLFFQNPNVALEFGFLTSRARDILILKDERSDMPSDLQGFIYRSFNIDNPDRSIPNQITQWLDLIDKNE